MSKADVLANLVSTGGILADGAITPTKISALHTDGGTMNGAITFANTQTWPTFNQNTTGNAATANNWTTARTLSLAGDATGNVSIDGSADATLTVAVADDSHNHTSSSGNFSVGGNLSVTGNLTINGTTTTVNSTVTTVDDPVITLGGDTAPSSDDSKDRGIEFRWHNGSAAKTGFFGFDDSTGYMMFIPDATNTSEVFSGTLGDIQATNFRGALFGNANTATTLATARTINGVSFDGSGNITVADSTKLPLAGGTLTGASTVSVATWQKWILETTGVTAKARQGSDSNGLNFTTNALWNGSWVEDDSTKKKFAYIQHLGNGRHEFRTAATGTGISWVTSLTADEAAVNSLVALQQGGNQVLHAGNYNSYALPLSGGTMTGAISFAAGQTWPTFNQSTTGNAATATTLQTARTINGTSFSGSANIKATEWFHSDRDFAAGTLVTTDINYAVSSGDPFILEIRGNSYGDAVPYDVQYQGYIYSDTIINHGGYSNGTNITGLVAINVGGNLCFWWPRQSYWNGFNVRAYTAYATYAVNRVTSITSTAKPTSTKEVALSANIRQSLHSSNFSSYALPASGGTIAGNGSIDFGPNTSWSATLRVGGNGHGGTGRASVVTTNGNLHLDGAASSGIYLNWYATSTPGVYFGNGAAGQVGRVTAAGLASFATLGLNNGFEIQQGGSNYGQFNTWVHLNGHYGLYAGTNGAHFYPNNGSYGSWKIDGSRNGWAGIEFGTGTSLMMNDDAYGFHRNTSGTWKFYVSGGNGYFPGNVTAYWSDARLKENLREIKHESLDILSAFTAYRFNWNAKVAEIGSTIPVGKEEIGLIAQQVQAALPDAVVVNKAGAKIGDSGFDYLTINYDRITPLLVEGVNIHTQEIKDLKSQVNELKELVQQLMKAQQ